MQCVFNRNALETLKMLDDFGDIHPSFVNGSRTVLVLSFHLEYLLCKNKCTHISPTCWKQLYKH